MRGRLIKYPHQSQCLRGNPLDDPHERDLYVYLPPQYDDKKRFGVVMMLAGFGSTNHSIVAWDAWKPNTVELFDRLVSQGVCKPAILVLPDAFNRWGGSQFIDSPATGLYQTYLADEVFSIVDQEFLTIPKREARAVVGRSSGGFGALRLGIDRPDVVSVIGSHAGDAAFDISMRPMLTNAAIAFDLAGGLTKFAEQIPNGGPQGAQAFDATFVLAASAAYAPRPSQKMPFTTLPFDIETGEINKEVWAQWLAHDPMTKITDDEDVLRTMSLVFLDAGNSDEHGLHFAARSMAKLLKKRDVCVEHEEFDGGHRGTSWRYEYTLPMILNALRT